MSRDTTYRPQAPADVTTSYHDGVLGRLRHRAVGRARPGVPEVVMIPGMAVCDYLLPGLGALAGWTRAHLLDLPGCCGGGEPPHELGVKDYARAVTDWLTHQDPAPVLPAGHSSDTDGPAPVLLAGHSSGTQVAAEAALLCPGRVAGIVLASPIFDPAVRGYAPVLRRWWQDRQRTPTSLDESQRPDRKRAGLRRTFHVLRVHLRHDLEEPLVKLPMPVLVIRGRDDALCTPGWGRRLAALGGEGHYVEVPGPHTFCWTHPDAWSAPIRDFAADVR